MRDTKYRPEHLHEDMKHLERLALELTRYKEIIAERVNVNCKLIESAINDICDGEVSADSAFNSLYDYGYIENEGGYYLTCGEDCNNCICSIHDETNENTYNEIEFDDDKQECVEDAFLDFEDSCEEFDPDEIPLFTGGSRGVNLDVKYDGGRLYFDYDRDKMGCVADASVMIQPDGMSRPITLFHTSILENGDVKFDFDFSTLPLSTPPTLSLEGDTLHLPKNAELHNPSSSSRENKEKKKKI